MVVVSQWRLFISANVIVRPIAILFSRQGIVVASKPPSSDHFDCGVVVVGNNCDCDVCLIVRPDLFVIAGCD